MKVDRWVSIAYSSSVSFHMEAHTDIGLPSTIVSDLLYILSDLIRALSISWGLVSCVHFSHVEDYLPGSARGGVYPLSY